MSDFSVFKWNAVALGTRLNTSPWPAWHQQQLVPSTRSGEMGTSHSSDNALVSQWHSHQQHNILTWQERAEKIQVIHGVSHSLTFKSYFPAIDSGF